MARSRNNNNNARDRQPHNGRNNSFKKGGGGAHNWGKPGDEQSIEQARRRADRITSPASSPVKLHF
ncbi:hypothetical protein BC831DRAFT_481492 [Entophlyctis helioformis]|nr:hypothetical protein BC831DRAFT_488737 [Entophlyctis helioformis]KAI8919520.1 hypothetical protein BC831DRAFT_481492 [Entophlyctis helioformis]